MNSRALGLLTLLTSVLLLGATAATWSSDTRATMVDDLDQKVVIEQTTSLSGAELAGGLLLIALLGMVVAGLMVRWPRAGLTLILLGGAGLVVTARGWPTTDATAAPVIAAVSGVAYLLLAGLSLRVAGQPHELPPDMVGANGPSRYTVEAVRDETTDDDEWNLAVADSALGDNGLADNALADNVNEDRG